MSKAYTEEFLNDFLDDLLTGPELARAQKLLTDDSEFRDEVEQWQAIRQTIKALPRAALPDHFQTQVLSSLTTNSPTTINTQENHTSEANSFEPLGRQSEPHHWNWKPVAGILGALAALVLVGIFLQYGQDFDRSVAKSSRNADQPKSASTPGPTGGQADVSYKLDSESKAGLPPTSEGAIAGAEGQKKDSPAYSAADKAQDPAKLEQPQLGKDSIGIERDEAVPKSLAMKQAVPRPAEPTDEALSKQMAPMEERSAQNRPDKPGMTVPLASGSELAVDALQLENSKDENRGQITLDSLVEPNPIEGKMVVQGQSLDVAVDEVWLIQIPSSPDRQILAHDMLARSGLNNNQAPDSNLDSKRKAQLADEYKNQEPLQETVEGPATMDHPVEMYLITSDLSAIENLLTQAKQFGNVVPVAPQDIPGLIPNDALSQNDASKNEQSQGAADADNKPAQFESRAVLNAQMLNRQLANRNPSSGLPIENENIVYLGTQTYRKSMALSDRDASGSNAPEAPSLFGQPPPSEDSKQIRNQMNQTSRSLAQSSATPNSSELGSGNAKRAGEETVREAGDQGLGGSGLGGGGGGGLGGVGGGVGGGEMKSKGQDSAGDQAASKEALANDADNRAPGASQAQRSLTGRQSSPLAQPTIREFTNRIPQTVEAGRTFNFLVLVQQLPPPTAVPQSDPGQPKNLSEPAAESIKKN